MATHKLRRGPAAALSPPGDAGDDRQPKRARTAGRAWLHSKDGEQDATPWKFNERMTNFAHELKGIQAIKAGDPDVSSDDVRRATEVDVEIFPMKTSLHMTERRNTYLFIRKHAKEVWDEVLQHDFDRSMVIGSPGIGKSVSSLYLLKKLLEKNALVIYEERRDKKVYVFVPPGQDGNNPQYMVYTVDYSPTTWLPQSCPALLAVENYYLIDPGGSTEDITVVMAHTIIFPSPDLERLGDWRKEAELFYLCPWTSQEVLAVRPFIKVNGMILEEETVESAYSRFGGVLRHVFASKERQRRLQEIAHTVLTDEKLVMGVYQSGVDGLCTRDQHKPPSALFTLVPTEDEDDDGEDAAEKRGTFRRFSSACIAVLSDWARKALVTKYWDNLQAKVKGRTHQDAVNVGWLFEEAAHLALARGGKFKRTYLDNEKKANDCITLSPRQQLIVAGGLDTCLLSIKNKQHKGLYLRPMNPKTLLDAAEGATTELYQITIDANHKLAVGPLKRAVMTLCEGKHALVINCVVPEDMFETFKLRKVPDDLKGRVQQRVIKCKPEP